jgi:flagellar hook-associated protein 2
MNTSQVIAQLMQLEAQPQTNLKNQVSQENLIISAYQTVNSKMAALQTAAEAFTAPNALTPTNPTWQAAKATSSSTAVTATATAGATTGSFTFNAKVAKAQVTTASFASASSTATAGGSSTVGITIGTGPTTPLTLTDTSVQGVADAINAAKTGVTAAVITANNPSGTGTLTYLQLTGNTGAANNFSVTGLSVTPTDISTAADATITVGDPNAGGYTVSSPNNTFTNVMKNVTLNVAADATGVTVNVASDQNAMADKMQALVDAANAALAQIGSYTSYNSDTKSGGPLTGDFTVRQLRDNILSSVSQGLSGYGSYKQAGVELDKDGKLTLDRNAFLAAYGANPSAVQNGVANGLAKSLDTVAVAATNFTTGTLTSQIQSGKNQITDLKKRITDWDSRLALRQNMLKRQFAAMETALGSLKNQSSWLAGQISGLPSSGN